MRFDSLSRYLRYGTFVLFVGSLSLSSAVHADVCVWRDPERSMLKLFPEARDYRTVTRKLDAAAIARIEQLIGEPLEPGEKMEFNFYEITGAGRSLGWAMALAGMGEYGVIEAVVGLEPDHRIRGVYLQRVRERKAEALKSPVFLDQFKGKRARDPLTVNPVPGAEKASHEIARVVKKMLAFDAVLNAKTLD
jgi:hypothetical protein